MKRGFTLIEILIVVAIGAVLLGVGVLSLNGLRSGNTVESEAQQLVAVLRSAQEKSIGQDTGGTASASRWGVYFDVVSQRQSYALFQVDESLKATIGFVGIPGTTIDLHTLPSSLTLTFQGGGVTSTLIFSKADGRPVATTTIEIKDDDRQNIFKNVIITSHGSIGYE